jgi:hypothetical protein
MAEPWNPKLHRLRECRGLLLDFLNGPYPGSMAERDLLDVCMDLPEPIDEDYVRRDLGYLEARGLVRRVVQASPAPRPGCAGEPPRYPKAVRWSLTADGVTFIERGKPWADLEAL